VSSSGVLAGPHSLGAAQHDGLKALALAVLLELFLLGFAAFVYTSGILRAAPVMKDSVVLQLGSLAPEPTPPTPPPPRKVEKRSPEPLKQPLPRQEPLPLPVPPVTQDSTPSPFAEKQVPVPPPPAARPTEAEILADYTSKIRDAVQTALIFPKAAESLGYTGRTRVEFRLHQGRQSGARVIVSSGINMFDRAALQAVQDAMYPPPPEVLAGQSRLFQIWVEFKR
jgi:protein TonB